MAYIIFDLDETLLNDERKIAPYTLKVMKKLQSMGHVIVPNTARSKQFAQEFLDALQPDFAILNGGTLIIDKDEQVLLCHALDVPTSRALIDELLPVAEEINVQTEQGMYSHMGRYTGQNAVAIDLKNEPFDFPLLKVIAKMEDEKAAQKIADKFDLEFTSYFGQAFRRYNKRGGTKANANRMLMEKLGGSLEDVISFGDDLGDLEMLQQAGIGVLMINAQEEHHGKVAVMSEYSNNEDGVARFLVKHFGLDMEAPVAGSKQNCSPSDLAGKVI